MCECDISRKTYESRIRTKVCNIKTARSVGLITRRPNYNRLWIFHNYEFYHTARKLQRDRPRHVNDVHCKCSVDSQLISYQEF